MRDPHITLTPAEVEELVRLVQSLPGDEELAAMVAELAPVESPRIGSAAVQIYLRSITRVSGDTSRWCCAMARTARGRALVIAAMNGEQPHQPPGKLTADCIAPGIFLASTTTANGRALHALIPWTQPVSLRERRTTIGMGDRLGLATPGHIRAARQYQVSPVLAQQSVRENDFIGRTFEDVVADATWGVFQEGYRDGYGADGDHLKTIPAIDVALGAAMPMVTLDLTEVMRPEVAEWSPAQVEEGFAQLDGQFRLRVEQEYSGVTFPLGEGDIAITIDPLEARRCAVMYGAALEFSRQVNDHLDAATRGAYDLEISIDETTTPTLPAHHLFIARELLHRNVVVNSLAPRFIGEFQKAVDYIGDISEFTRQFRVHCRIAREFGNYKVSVHSGSDKFTVFPVVGKETAMRLHLKTSGTSWLEALRTLALHEPPVYRRLHAFAREYYPTALTHYHITADFDSIAPLDTVADEDLPGYLEHPAARQMLHISYGGILRNTDLSGALYAALHRREEEYAQVLVHHFNRHIGGVGAPHRG